MTLSSPYQENSSASSSTSFPTSLPTFAPSLALGLALGTALALRQAVEQYSWCLPPLPCRGVKGQQQRKQIRCSEFISGFRVFSAGWVFVWTIQPPSVSLSVALRSSQSAGLLLSGSGGGALRTFCEPCALELPTPF